LDKAALEPLTEQFSTLIRERFPGAPIERVAVLRYGDEPEIEPGQLLGRVYLAAGGEREEREQVLEDFHQAHRPAVRELRRDLDRLPEVGFVEFVAGDDGGDCGPRIQLAPGGRSPLAVAEGPLVPVMARLGPADVETVDVLITAGIAANRAEAVRWALARIRERPAYAQLQQRAREIEELKNQF
jgi:hypothetical protein